jgi:hypothetical protein
VQSSGGTALPGVRAAPAIWPRSGILDRSCADATGTVVIIAACFVLAGRVTSLLIPRASDTGAPQAQDEKNPGAAERAVRISQSRLGVVGVPPRRGARGWSVGSCPDAMRRKRRSENQNRSATRTGGRDP